MLKGFAGTGRYHMFNTYGLDWEQGPISLYVDGFLWAHYKLNVPQPEYLIADPAARSPLTRPFTSLRAW
ncbi:MAG: hypothetical protein WAV54_15830 [Acidimicrobiales bacterium]